MPTSLHRKGDCGAYIFPSRISTELKESREAGTGKELCIQGLIGRGR